METTPVQQNNESPATTDLSDLKSLMTTAQSEWKQWIGIALISIVLILGIFLYRARSQSNEELASRMLGEARSGQAVQAVMAQYPRTSAASLALLQIAKIQYDSGEFVSALSSYTDFIARNPDHLMTPVAELGKIHCSEAMGQTADALTAFSAFASQHPEHYLAPQALFGKARCLQRLNRFAEARAVYEDFLAAHPNNPWERDVRESLRHLDKESRKTATTKTVP